jgi:hypothetical protein
MVPIFKKLLSSDGPLRNPFLHPDWKSGVNNIVLFARELNGNAVC